MIFKNGVYVRGVSPEVVLALMALREAYVKVSQTPFVVTSCSEGTHGRKSLHYSGRAVDVRSRDLTPAQRVEVLELGRSYLPADFDLIHEESPPHFHLEYDPRGRMP